MRGSPLLYAIGVVMVILFSPLLFIQWLWLKGKDFIKGVSCWRSDPTLPRRDSHPHIPPHNTSTVDSSHEGRCNMYPDQRSVKPTTAPRESLDPSQFAPLVRREKDCGNDTFRSDVSNSAPSIDRP